MVGEVTRTYDTSPIAVHVTVYLVLQEYYSSSIYSYRIRGADSKKEVFLLSPNVDEKVFFAFNQFTSVFINCQIIWEKIASGVNVFFSSSLHLSCYYPPSDNTVSSI